MPKKAVGSFGKALVASVRLLAFATAVASVGPPHRSPTPRAEGQHGRRHVLTLIHQLVDGQPGRRRHHGLQHDRDDVVSPVLRIRLSFQLSLRCMFASFAESIPIAAVTLHCTAVRLATGHAHKSQHTRETIPVNCTVIRTLYTRRYQQSCGCARR